MKKSRQKQAAKRGGPRRTAGRGETAGQAGGRLLRGVLSLQHGGMGFARPAQGADIYISPHHLAGAWHGDRVLVELLPARHGKKPEGRIAEVLERGVKSLPVRAIRPAGHRPDGAPAWICRAVDPRLSDLLLADCSALSVEQLAELKEGDLILARPVAEEADDGARRWRLYAQSLLGREDKAGVQEAMVKASHGIAQVFPKSALDEAERLALKNPLDCLAREPERRDLRHLSFVTIDGRRARDFDDAIFVRKEDAGFRLFVAIADVSHYVRPKSALDAEALRRGNSYYFPQSVEPMLPEALSNGLCSLNPGQPRLVLAAELLFDQNGKNSRAEFYAGLIQSQARLTYGQVQRALWLDNATERKNLAPALPMLQEAEALARILTLAQERRGGLDFDLPEPEWLYNAEDNVIGVRPRERHFGHRMIEAFMVAANEAVARYLGNSGQGFLYRAHPGPAPEKLENLAALLSGFGLLSALPNPLTPSALQSILKSVADGPKEYPVHRLVLRSMMQAGYQLEKSGHFGLASAAYCHFTSPIRRYADLTVHRALKAALGLQGGVSASGRRLRETAESLNRSERTAAEAERETTRRMGVLLLLNKQGEQLAGIVAGLSEFGVFVELGDYLVEGLLRLENLPDDFYVYVPERQEIHGRRTGLSFRLGQSLDVTISQVSLARLEIDLLLAGNKAKPARRTTGNNRAGQINKKGLKHASGHAKNRRKT